MEVISLDVAKDLRFPVRTCPHCGDLKFKAGEIFICPVCIGVFCNACSISNPEGNGKNIFCPICAALLELPPLASLVKCPRCGNPTEYNEDSDPAERLHHVDGLGTFCPECYLFTFGVAHRGSDGVLAYNLTCSCRDCRRIVRLTLNPSA